MLGTWHSVPEMEGNGSGTPRAARPGQLCHVAAQERPWSPAHSHSFPSAPSTSTSGLGLAMPEERASRESHCASANSSAQASRPHPSLFPIQLLQDTELSCVCLLCRLRFAAAVSPRLSPSPPPLPDGLLCGSAESPTPFLCGITMAAGVSLPALAIQLAVSDAILCSSGALRRQRSSGAAWGTDAGSRDRTAGEQGFQTLEGN